jgi:glycosyltransferase involved in cell wall biosynthesis
MSKVTVIIPSRNEQFLNKTITDILNKATGEIEVIPVLDEDKSLPRIEDPRIKYISFAKDMGMRYCINAGAAAATGEFLLKTDGHCMFAPGFDEVLKAECDNNWVVIPRRRSLDAENWTFLENGKAPVDYHYLSYPFYKEGEIGMHGNVWNQRAKDRINILLDEEMSSQGSCWLMTKKHFDTCLKGLSEIGYERFVQEMQEIGLKTWLSGGKLMINKKTWYAHLHKGKNYGRGYFISKNEMIRGARYSADFWMNNRWKERKYDLEWLIEHFWPVPTWPTDPALWRRTV